MIEFFDSKLNEKYYKFSHKSGLNIYVFPKKLSTSYALFGTEYGSVDNCLKLKGDSNFTQVPDGIAHYLEHRMFTQKDGSDITERFSEFGADSNAYTSFNKTVYMCSTTDNFEKALEALLDFVTEPNFTEELVERERGIIIQEIKMTDDSPYSRGYRDLLEAMYKNNSARVDIAGTVESVSQITAEMLNKCYDTFYNPDNMALVVCGDVTPKQVLEIADRVLPDTFAGKEVERSYCDNEPQEVFEKLREVRMEVSKPIFTIGVINFAIISVTVDHLVALPIFSLNSFCTRISFLNGTTQYKIKNRNFVFLTNYCCFSITCTICFKNIEINCRHHYIICLEICLFPYR